jgi:hypothetical protein
MAIRNRTRGRAMSIEAAIVSIVKASGYLDGLIGGRIYPNIVPQAATLPAVAYQRISGARYHTHTGPASLARPRFQFAILAETYAAARAVAEAIRLTLNGYAGTVSGTTIQSIQLQNEIDQYDKGENRPVILIDFYIYHQEETEIPT